MESGNERTFLGQLRSALDLVMDGQRSMTEVGRALQLVNDRADFASILDAPRQANLVTSAAPDIWVPKWEEFYRAVYGVTTNLLPVFKAAPEAPPEFGWPVFAIPDVPLNRTWAECRNLFPSHSYVGDDLERTVPENDRAAAKGAYLVRFRNRVEADQEMKNISARQLRERGVKCITLHERLLLEQMVYLKTGGFHPDLVNVTLCAGSRYAFGSVPCASWGGGRFRVSGYYPGSASDDLRTRVAV